jgi:hypothetical protein
LLGRTTSFIGPGGRRFARALFGRSVCILIRGIVAEVEKDCPDKTLRFRKGVFTEAWNFWVVQALVSARMMAYNRKSLTLEKDATGHSVPVASSFYLKNIPAIGTKNT